MVVFLVDHLGKLKIENVEIWRFSGLEKTDGGVFELIISGNWKTFFQFKLLENLPRYCWAFVHSCTNIYFLQIANLVNSKFRSLAICSRLWFHQSGGAEDEEGQRGCSQTVFVITSSYFSEYLHTFFPPITKSFLSDPSPIIGNACQ